MEGLSFVGLSLVQKSRAPHFAATAAPSQTHFLDGATDVDDAVVDVTASKAALKSKQTVRRQKELASDPEPIGPMTGPLNLVATMSDMTGCMDLTWKAVRGADGYPVEMSPNVLPRVWTQVSIASRPDAEIDGLTSGQVYAFRVAAVGPSGRSPWSDEAIKMAP